MAYLQVYEIKQYIDITSGDDDSLLIALISQAQSMIETLCKRRFEAASDTTRYFDAEADVVCSLSPFGGRRVLTLDEDLYSVTSVVNGDGTTVSSTQYVLNPRNEPPYYEIELKANSSIAWTYSDTPENAIAVTGRWAYSLTPPNDVKWAAGRLTAWLYRQRDTSMDLDRPMLSNSGIVLMPSSIPNDVTKVLERYYRWS